MCPASSTSSTSPMTTTTLTSGDCLPTALRSPTRSPKQDFVLTLWTADPMVAHRAEIAGVDRIGVDLEILGKAERQAGLGTWISPHKEADLVVLRALLS